MIHMTELEERLAQPDGARLRERLVASLAQMELRLRHPHMLTREEYREVSALVNAAHAAQEVLMSWPVGPHRSTAFLPSPKERP